MSIFGACTALTAGQIINTCGWVDGEGYDLLVKAIEALRCRPDDNSIFTRIV